MKIIIAAMALALGGASIANAQTNPNTQMDPNMQMDPNGPGVPPGTGITSRGMNPNGQAYVPPGFNAGMNVYPPVMAAPGGMAGMQEYPVCTRQATDRCVQAYTATARSKRMMNRRRR